jgi:hypothetical protein
MRGRGGGWVKSFIQYDKDKKRPSKSHETVPLMGLLFKNLAASSIMSLFLEVLYECNLTLRINYDLKMAI